MFNNNPQTLVVKALSIKMEPREISYENGWWGFEVSTVMNECDYIHRLQQRRLLRHTEESNEMEPSLGQWEQ
jgi:hypothetical protein